MGEWTGAAGLGLAVEVDCGVRGELELPGGVDVAGGLQQGGGFEDAGGELLDEILRIAVGSPSVAPTGLESTIVAVRAPLN